MKIKNFLIGTILCSLNILYSTNTLNAINSQRDLCLLSGKNDYSAVKEKNINFQYSNSGNIEKACINLGEIVNCYDLNNKLISLEDTNGSTFVFPNYPNEIGLIKSELQREFENYEIMLSEKSNYQGTGRGIPYHLKERFNKAESRFKKIYRDLNNKLDKLQYEERRTILQIGNEATYKILINNYNKLEESKKKF